MKLENRVNIFHLIFHEILNTCKISGMLKLGYIQIKNEYIELKTFQNKKGENKMKEKNLEMKVSLFDRNEEMSTFVETYKIEKGTKYVCIFSDKETKYEDKALSLKNLGSEELHSVIHFKEDTLKYSHLNKEKTTVHYKALSDEALGTSNLDEEDLIDKTLRLVDKKIDIYGLKEAQFSIENTTFQIKNEDGGQYFIELKYE